MDQDGLELRLRERDHRGGVRRLDLAVEQANSEGPIARWAAEWNALKAGHRAGMRGVQELVR